MGKYENYLKQWRLTIVMNKRTVKAINLTTEEAHYCPSLYSVQKELGVSVGLVQKICVREYGRKSGRSKYDDYYYTFEYVD